MDTPETHSGSQSGENNLSPTYKTSIDHNVLLLLRTQNASLVAQLEGLQASYQTLELQKNNALRRIVELEKVIEEVSSERDTARDEKRGLEARLKEREEELTRKIEEGVRENEELRTEVGSSRDKIEELEDDKRKKVKLLSQTLDSTRIVKEKLARVIESVSEDTMGIDAEEVIEDVRLELGMDELETRIFWEEMEAISRLANEAEMKVIEYQEARKKEKMDLENSLVSLTEENRDINSLLRVALVEKEAVEKSLNRLKGNNEQKRVAILEIAERGLQKFGFGFMMGAANNDPSPDNSSASVGSKSDSSECEEEVISLASTVEKIMKNLRLEISQLRKSLEESRSDTERLQCLTEQQAQKIAENILYIKELENRETLLAQNVEELLMELKQTEEEVARWREACELEVEAGKSMAQERDKVAAILKQELDKTKAAFRMLNSKLKLKEQLAAAAMAAQAAAERSLRLADERVAFFRERIEELIKQLEEAESRGRHSHRRVRRICWPCWQVLKAKPFCNASTRVRNMKGMLPDMQALLHHTD